MPAPIQRSGPTLRCYRLLVASTNVCFPPRPFQSSRSAIGQKQPRRRTLLWILTLVTRFGLMLQVRNDEIDVHVAQDRRIERRHSCDLARP